MIGNAINILKDLIEQFNSDRIRRNSERFMGANVEIWEDPRFIDRYMVVINDDVFTMSLHPLSPAGINQYIGKRFGIRPSGKRINLLEVPPEVRVAILERIRHRRV